MGSASVAPPGLEVFSRPFPGLTPREKDKRTVESPRRGRQMVSPGCEPRILRYISHAPWCEPRILRYISKGALA